jgi:transposase-like protein
VLPSASGADLMAFIGSAVAEGQTVRTDGWSGYRKAEAAGFSHVRLVEGAPENTSELFPLVHTLFANLKAWIGDTFHGVSATWLPAYIAEFTYRFNRRAHTHSGSLWRFMLRRLVQGAWRPWGERHAEYEDRRAA